MKSPAHQAMMSSMQNNPMAQIMQMINGGTSPQVILQQMLQNNPQAQSTLQTLQSQANGRSPREMVFQLAQQAGISEREIMQLASKMGLK